MEQYINKTTSNTPKTGRNGYTNKNELLEKRKHPISINGHSDFESGDEIHPINNDTTAINSDTLNGDSDLSSTSSQTSSEHDPSLRTRVSPMKNWPDESTTNNLVSKDTQSNEITTSFDQVPEYKLFSSNVPSIHSILFGNHENSIDHDLREIEKRLIGKIELKFSFFFLNIVLLANSLDNTSYSQTQENDELGFDPCNLFMSALASDIENEQRPSLSNSYGFSSSQNSSWIPQQQQQQRYPHSFSKIDESSSRQMWNANQQQQQQQQQRFPSQYSSNNCKRKKKPNNQSLYSLSD